MKNKKHYILFFILLCSFIYSWSQDKTGFSVIRLNDIVGDTIDRDEKLKYGLFSDIEGIDFNFAIYLFSSDQMNLRIFKSDSSYYDFKYSAELFLKDSEQVMQLNARYSVSKEIIEPAKHRYLTLGHRNNGIVFGNSKQCNGLRINLVDKQVSLINGLSLGLINQPENKINGVTIGLYGYSRELNGMGICAFVAEAKKLNGLVIGGGVVVNKLNGVGIGGLYVYGDTLNGFLFSPLFIHSWNYTERIKLVNGFAFAIIRTEMDALNGLAVSLINETKELHGVQIGLWNIAWNKRFFKQMPFINFNFRRKRKPAENKK